MSGLQPKFGKIATSGVHLEQGYVGTEMIWSKPLEGSKYSYTIRLDSGTHVRLVAFCNNPGNQWDGLATTVDVDWGDGTKSTIRSQIIDSGRFNRGVTGAMKIEHDYAGGEVGFHKTITIQSVEPLFPIGDCVVLEILGSLPDDIYENITTSGERIGLFPKNKESEWTPSGYPEITQIWRAQDTLTKMGPKILHNAKNTSMEAWFQGCKGLVEVPEGFISELQLRSLTSTKDMFRGTSVSRVPELLLGEQNDVIEVMDGMFAETKISRPLRLRESSSVVSINSVYAGCKELRAAKDCFWVLPNCKEASQVFANCSSMTDVGPMVFSEVPEMQSWSAAFYGTKITRFTYPDTPKVIDVSDFFTGCHYLEYFDTKKLFQNRPNKDLPLCIDRMFSYCSEYTIKGLNIRHLGLDHNDRSLRFRDDKVEGFFSYTKIDTDRARPLAHVFGNCSATPFTTKDMFKGAIVYDIGVLFTCDTITSLESVFESAEIRRTDRYLWDCPQLTSVKNGFKNCHMEEEEHPNTRTLGRAFRPTWFEKSPKLWDFSGCFSGDYPWMDIQKPFDDFVRSTDVTKIDLQDCFRTYETTKTVYGRASYHPVHDSVPKNIPILINTTTVSEKHNCPMSMMFVGRTLQEVGSVNKNRHTPYGVTFWVVPTNRTVTLRGETSTIRQVNWGDHTAPDTRVTHDYPSTPNRWYPVTIQATGYVYPVVNGVSPESKSILGIHGEFPYGCLITNKDTYFQDCQFIGKRVFGLLAPNQIQGIRIQQAIFEDGWQQHRNGGAFVLPSIVENTHQDWRNMIFTSMYRESDRFGDAKKDVNERLGFSESGFFFAELEARQRYDYYQMVCQAKSRTISFDILSGGVLQETKVTWYTLQTGNRGSVTLNASTKSITGNWNIDEEVLFTFSTTTSAWWIRDQAHRNTIHTLLGTFPTHTFPLQERMPTLAPNLEKISESFLYMCQNTNMDQFFKETNLRMIPPTLFQYIRATSYRECFKQTQIRMVPDRLLYSGMDDDIDCTDMFANCYQCKRITSIASDTHRGVFTVDNMFTGCTTSYYQTGNRRANIDVESLFRGLNYVGDPNLSYSFDPQVGIGNTIHYVVSRKPNDHVLQVELEELCLKSDGYRLEHLYPGQHNAYLATQIPAKVLLRNEDVSMFLGQDVFLYLPYITTLLRNTSQGLEIYNISRDSLWMLSRLRSLDLFQNCTIYGDIPHGIFLGNRLHTMEKLVHKSTYEGGREDAASTFFYTDWSHVMSARKMFADSQKFGTIKRTTLGRNSVWDIQEMFAGEVRIEHKTILQGLGKESTYRGNKPVDLIVQGLFRGNPSRIVMDGWLDGIRTTLASWIRMSTNFNSIFEGCTDVVLQNPNQLYSGEITTAKKLFAESGLETLPHCTTFRSTTDFTEAFYRSNIQTIPEGWFALEYPANTEVSLEHMFGLCPAKVPNNSGYVRGTGGSTVRINVYGMYENMIADVEDDETLANFKNIVKPKTLSRVLNIRDLFAVNIHIKKPNTTIIFKTIIPNYSIDGEICWLVPEPDAPKMQFTRTQSGADGEVFRYTYKNPGIYEVDIFTDDAIIYPDTKDRFDDAVVVDILTPIKGKPLHHLSDAGGLAGLFGTKGLQTVLTKGYPKLDPKAGLFRDMKSLDNQRSISKMFQNLEDLEHVTPYLLEGLPRLVSRMDHLFENCKKLKSVELAEGYWVGDILGTGVYASYAFANSGITAIQKSWMVNTQAVYNDRGWLHDISHMYQNCDLSNDAIHLHNFVFGTNLRNMEYAFDGTSLDISRLADCFPYHKTRSHSLERLDYAFRDCVISDKYGTPMQGLYWKNINHMKGTFARTTCEEPVEWDMRGITIEWTHNTQGYYASEEKVTLHCEEMFQNRTKATNYATMNLSGRQNYNGYKIHFEHIYQNTAMNSVQQHIDLTNLLSKGTRIYMQYMYSNIKASNGYVSFPIRYSIPDSMYSDIKFYTEGCFENIVSDIPENQIFNNIPTDPVPPNSKVIYLGESFQQHLVNVRGKTVTVHTMFDHLVYQSDISIGITEEMKNGFMVIDWGDGTKTTIPKLGFIYRDQVQTIQHTYSHTVDTNLWVKINAPFACFIKHPTDEIKGMLGKCTNNTIAFGRIPEFRDYLVTVSSENLLGNSNITSLDGIFQDCQALVQVCSEVFPNEVLSAKRTFANCPKLQIGGDTYRNVGFVPYIRVQDGATLEETFTLCPKLYQRTAEIQDWVAVKGKPARLIGTWKKSKVERVPKIEDDSLSLLTSIDECFFGADIQDIGHHFIRDGVMIETAVNAFSYSTYTIRDDFKDVLRYPMHLTDVSGMFSHMPHFTTGVEECFDMINRILSGMHSDRITMRNMFSYNRFGELFMQDKLRSSIALVKDLQIIIPDRLRYVNLEGLFLQCGLQYLRPDIVTIEDEAYTAVIKRMAFEGNFMFPKQNISKARVFENAYGLGTVGRITYKITGGVSSSLQLKHIYDTSVEGAYDVDPIFVRIYTHQTLRTDKGSIYSNYNDVDHGEYHTLSDTESYHYIYPTPDQRKKYEEEIPIISENTRYITIESDRMVVPINLTESIQWVWGYCPGGLQTGGNQRVIPWSRDFTWNLFCPKANSIGVQPNIYNTKMEPDDIEEEDKGKRRWFHDWCRGMTELRTVHPMMFQELTDHYHIMLEDFFRDSGIEITGTTLAFLRPVNHPVSLARMFMSCPNVVEIPEGFLFTLYETLNYSRMFSDCPNLRKIPSGLVHIRR